MYAKVLMLGEVKVVILEDVSKSEELNKMAAFVSFDQL